jgi:hypothetical protein
MPNFDVSVANFGSADYKGLTTLGEDSPDNDTEPKTLSYKSYYAQVLISCQDISVTITVSGA